MAAIIAKWDTRRKDVTKIESYAQTNEYIYEGALCMTDAAGYIANAADTAGRKFLGVAVTGYDNSAGSAGDNWLDTWKDGVFLFKMASATVADIGKTVFIGASNDTVTLTANNLPVGQIRYIRSSLTSSDYADGNYVGVEILTAQDAVEDFAVIDDLTVGDTLAVTGIASFADGAEATPSITNIGDTNTGFWFSDADTINVSAGGSEVAEIDASGINGSIGATTPAAGVFTSLTAASGNAVSKPATSSVDNLVANSTTRTTVFVATSNCVITKASIGFYAIPASTSGTVLGNLKAWDASANAERNLLETADFDMEGMTAKEGSAMTLTSSNPTYLELDAGDVVYWESVSNNADMTGGTDGALTLEIILD